MESTHQTAVKEAARLLRVWKMKHRARASVAELAEELGIEPKRIQSWLLAKDDLSDLTESILVFLDRWKTDAHVRLKDVNGGVSRVIPPPHVRIVYPASVQAKILTRRLNHAEETGESPYCLLTRKEIDGARCAQTQRPELCVGCGAATRFCVECGLNPIAFSGSEICAVCLTMALKNPETDLPDEHVRTVACHLSGGRMISRETCRRMQGEHCGTCDAVTRLCTGCKTRRVRYTDLALCLACRTELFNPNWEPLSDDELEERLRNREDCIETSLSPVHEEKKGDQSVPAKEPEPIVGSTPTAELIRLFHTIWKKLQGRYPRLPNVTILPATSTAQTKFGGRSHIVYWNPKKKSDGSVMHTILVAPEFLDRPVTETLGELVHQAARILETQQKGIVQIRRDYRRYHSRMFKKIAEVMGLSAKKHPTQYLTFGYAVTCLSVIGVNTYREEISELQHGLVRIGAMPGTSPNGKTQKRFDDRYRIEVQCACGFTAKINHITLHRTTIRCDTCNQPFTER